MRKEMEELVGLDRERTMIGHINSILSWDQETFMPEAAVEERSDQLAFIEGLAHEKLTNPRIGELLFALGSTSKDRAGDPSLPPVERAYLRVLRREYDQETKLPASLVTEYAKAQSLSQAAWIEARKANDFKAFEPHLRSMIDFNRKIAACLDPARKPYDVLLDLYEPGTDEASIAAVFSELRAGLVALIERINGKPQIDDAVLRRRCRKETQEAAGSFLMDELAFDATRGRLDASAHPFTTTLGADDVRITTRYDEDFFPSNLFSVIHETGHALYELGIDTGKEFRNTALSQAVSMGIHESQSRFWENTVGRSGEFWKPRYARLKEILAPALDGVSFDDFRRAVNRVSPSLIRVEADEVTYCLHVILRFELEAALVNGKLDPAGLPAAWNDKMKSFLGVVPATDALGCMQDVHWATGLFGYFPSYALGTMYASQFTQAMKAGDPAAASALASGDCRKPLEWLRANIHRRGAEMFPPELCLEVTGAALTPRAFLAYLDRKYSEIYGL
ncbi:MAG: carboxypeptidase M32 [Spirochaetes bacterium]|nr:carboxypeptidase M32 [Spirochaetota bacterium]